MVDNDPIGTFTFDEQEAYEILEDNALSNFGKLYLHEVIRYAADLEEEVRQLNQLLSVDPAADEYYPNGMSIK